MVPQSRAVPVLITRPEPQASRFAKFLDESFGTAVKPVISPLMKTEFIHPEFGSDQYDALILTSEAGARAAKFLSSSGVHLPPKAFCVGNRTSQVAKAGGFLSVSADGSADDLIGLISKSDNPLRLLHLRGEETRGDIANRLGKLGHSVTERIVYRQIRQNFTSEALILLQNEGLVIVPLFSPLSASNFELAIMGLTVLARLEIVAFSSAVAESAKELPARQIVVCAAPNLPEMGRTMSQLLHSP